MFNQGKSTSIAVAALFLILLTKTSEGTPLSKCRDSSRYKFPCGESIINAPRRDVNDSLPKLIGYLKETQTMAVKLENLLRWRVAGQTGRECDMNGQAVVLGGFPDISKPWTDILVDTFNVTLHLKEDYRSLTTVYVFMEQTIRDENEKDYGNYTKEFRMFCRRLRDTLCSMVLSMENRSLEPLDRSVMPDIYRQGDRAMDYWRDYLLIKNTMTLVNTMKFKYQALLEIHRVSETYSEKFDSLNPCQ